MKPYKWFSAWVRRLGGVVVVFFVLGGVRDVQAQLYTGATNTGTWASARWTNASNAVNFTNAWVQNSDTIFLAGLTYTFAGSGTVTNGNVTVQSNATVTFTANSGTWGTGGNVRTIDLGTNSLLDFSGNAISTATGTGFIKTGSGVFAMSGATFGGGFTLNGGTVVMRGVNAMGGGASHVLTISNGVIAANATRSMDNTKYGGGIRIAGNFQMGALSNSYATNAQALISDSASISFANNVSLEGATRTVTIGGNGTYTYSGVISNGGLNIVGGGGATGTFLLSGANTFADGLSLNSGTLRATTSANALGAGSLTLGGGTLQLVHDGGLNFGRNTTVSGNATINSDRASASASAGSTNTLGTLSIGAQTLNLTKGGNITNGIAALTFGATTLSAAGANFNAAGGTLLTLGAVSGGTFGFSVTGDGNTVLGDVVATSGDLTKSGLGILTLSAANTLTGRTSLNAGTLSLNHLNALQNSVLDTGSAGAQTVTFSVAGNNTYNLGGLQGSDGLAIGANSLSVGSAGGNTTYSGVISGTGGGLTKTGAGNLTLNQTNTYTGATTVSQGTLLIDSGGSIASSSLTTVNSGGALMLNGTVGNLSVASGGSLLGSGTVSGSATIAGSLQPGNSPGILNVTSDLTLTNGASMVWELFKNVSTQETPAAFDQVLVGGNLLFTGGNSINVNFGSTADGSSVNWSNAFWENNQSWQIFSVSGSTTGFGNLTLNVNTNDAGGIALSSVREGASFELSQAGSDILLNYKAIPEPSSSMLMVLGAAGLIGIRAFGRKRE